MRRYVLLLVASFIFFASSDALGQAPSNQAQTLSKVQIVLEPAEPVIVRNQDFDLTAKLIGGMMPYKRFKLKGILPVGFDLVSSPNNDEIKLHADRSVTNISDSAVTIKYVGRDENGNKAKKIVRIPVINEPPQTQGIAVTVSPKNLDVLQKSTTRFTVAVQGLNGFQGNVRLSLGTVSAHLIAGFDRQDIPAGQSALLTVVLINEVPIDTVLKLDIFAVATVQNRTATAHTDCTVTVVEESTGDSLMFTTVDLNFTHPEQRIATSMIGVTGGSGQYAFRLMSDQSGVASIETVNNIGILTQRYVGKQLTYNLVIRVTDLVTEKSLDAIYLYHEYDGPHFFGIEVGVDNGFEFNVGDIMRLKIRYQGNFVEADVIVFLIHPEVPGEIYGLIDTLHVVAGQEYIIPIQATIPLQPGLVFDPHQFKIVVVSKVEVQIGGSSEDLYFKR